MTCAACKRGGEMLTIGRDEGRVVSQHKQCEYPASCPCQHRLESQA